MAFPEETLSEGEKVMTHLHPHGITMFWPTFWTIVTIGGGGTGIAYTLSKEQNVGAGAVAVIALVLFIWLGLAPFIVWRSTHYVLTDKQVIIRQGVFNRNEKKIPLGKVNDHSTSQSLLDRILRSGSVMIESAGEKGQEELHRVPSVIKVNTLLTKLSEDDEDKHQLDEGEMRELLREHRAEGGKL
jgi:uncharacterized membrane protein YdbT with pleckstrin-like domain